MYNQLCSYFDNIISRNQCGFRKGHSAQQCLLVMIEKFKESIDQGHQFGALLTYLSKAFDCIDHKLLSGTRMEFRFHQLIYFLLT